jgi:hypothetical protein
MVCLIVPVSVTLIVRKKIKVLKASRIVLFAISFSENEVKVSRVLGTT